MFRAITAFDFALLQWLRAYDAPWLDTLMFLVTISGIMGGVWQLIAPLSLFAAPRRAAA